MDKEHKNPEVLENDDWLDALLGTNHIADELGADESAMAQAGLTHPDDAEVERIVQETLAQIWEEEHIQEASQEALERTPQEGIEATQMFQPGELSEEPAQPESKPVHKQPEKKAGARKPAEEPPETGKKGRPKVSKDTGLLAMLYSIPHILSTVIWLAVVVMVGVSLGRVLWVCAADVLAFNKEPIAATITVTLDDTAQDVSQKLEKAGLVRYPNLFELFADITGKGENISVGTHTFSGEMIYDYNALINAMTDYGPARETVEIMFPEGYNCAQIFALLEENGVCTVEELEKCAASGELEDYWFLEGVKRGHKYCLEGYLAPDTYKFYVDDEPDKVLEKFLDEFDDRFNDHLRQRYIELNQTLSDMMRANGYGSEYIADHQMSLHDVIIVASIIEKESGDNIESYTIASVFYNRLTNPSEYPTLGSDATILYATEYYNKGELNTEAQINASPFNTYTNPGLPYGPISNPGLNSLGAALDPQDTNYHFFVYDEDAREHLFSVTYSEHMQKVKELGLDE